MTSTSIFRQLYLFDCDGGRSQLFSEHIGPGQLPNSCELYLFWNCNDVDINIKLNQLANNQQIHLCPSHRINSKNSADAKLIYFLSKLVNQFSTITIVHGNDEIFEEAAKIVEYEFGMDKILLHQVTESTPNQLKTLVGNMRKINSDKQYRENEYELIEENLRLKSRSIELQYLTKCPQCHKSFQNTTGTISHLMAKHNNDLVSIKMKDIVSLLVTRVEKNDIKPITMTSNKTEPLRCSDPACLSKKKTFKNKKALDQHQISKHVK